MICSSFHTFLYVIKLVKTRPLCSSSDFLSHFFMRKVNPPIGWRRGPTAAGVLVVSLYRVNRFRWREIRLMVFHPKTSWIPLLMKDLNDKASLHSISIVTGSQTTYPWWDLANLSFARGIFLLIWICFVRHRFDGFDSCHKTYILYLELRLLLKTLRIIMSTICSVTAIVHWRPT